MSIVEGTQSVTVTGQGVTPQSKARGVVTFRNLTQQAVTIPVGRWFERWTMSVSRRHAREKCLQVWMRLWSCPSKLWRADALGNVEAETIVVVEGRLGLSLSVTNPEPLTGGRETPSVQASDADRERAKDPLTGELESEARARLADELNAGDVLFR